MSNNMKHNNGTIGASMAVDRHADAHTLSMFRGRFHSGLTERERAEARAAIDNAMQSVGQVLEVSLQAMGNLRVAQAALVLYDDGPPPPSELGEPRKTR
ncbi:hypothetical protein [Burkholderia glumae]|uniref:Uncharacterized protein n=1 Tax=Burkholderia glumae TaxID=337 RepID=A0ABY5BK55_BURGL|nr:hypothetical protein [Burkholderia glumae]MCR1767679.1 hypothetical protein [Burkholderia glumae]USS46409.1 hypothetical protein NFI99_15955 [Burkholderia glumae]UVS94611.1 hypothetical protein EFP19_01685 [Burkholderia glumae]